MSDRLQHYARLRANVRPPQRGAAPTVRNKTVWSSGIGLAVKWLALIFVGCPLLLMGAVYEAGNAAQGMHGSLPADVVALGVVALGFRSWQQRRETSKTAPGAATHRRPGEVALYVGEATGILSHVGHAAGLQKGHKVILVGDDAAQNVCCMGGIGSGKTTRFVQPALAQLLSQDCGGIIIDVKGDFGETALALAKEAGREVVRIGPGATPMNLTAGLTPETAASFLKAVFAAEGARAHDTIWVRAATDLLYNGLGVLSFFPDAYTLADLTRYVYDDDWRRQTNAAALEYAAVLRRSDDAHNAERLEIFTAYHDSYFSKLNDRTSTSVLFQVRQALAGFQMPGLRNAFCAAEGPSMQSVVDGTIYLVDLPLSVYGESAKTAYQMIKLRFFNVVSRRRSEPAWNKTRYVFFVCDEYQQLISAEDDLKFWDTSRSARCIGIISGQAIGSFVSAIGDKELAYTILQNFRQKICFRTEDLGTIKYFEDLIGQVDQATISTSKQAKLFGDARSGETLAYRRQAVVDAQMFRQLDSNSALAVLNLGGTAFDDVLHLTPLYVNT